MVILTPFSLRDVGALVEANRDEEMAKRFDFPPGPPATGEARRAITDWQRSWRMRRLVAFAVRALGSADLIGGANFEYTNTRSRMCRTSPSRIAAAKAWRHARSSCYRTSGWASSSSSDSRYGPKSTISRRKQLPRGLASRARACCALRANIGEADATWCSTRAYRTSSWVEPDSDARTRDYPFRQP